MRFVIFLVVLSVLAAFMTKVDAGRKAMVHHDSGTIMTPGVSRIEGGNKRKTAGSPHRRHNRRHNMGAYPQARRHN